MIKFTICFIKQGNRILLLNRESPSWMGCWNGVGGKLEPNESPRESMIREIKEETELSEFKLYFKGIMTWKVDGSKLGGMYAYVAELSDDTPYITPIKTREGILDWKEYEWIMNPKNMGVAANIPRCLDKVLFDSNCYDHHSTYYNGKLYEHVSEIINPLIEEDNTVLTDELSKYYELNSETGIGGLSPQISTDSIHSELLATINLVYNSCGFACSTPLLEAQNAEYGAYAFSLNSIPSRFRVAKITPTKVGQFVTLWERVGNGPIQPYDMLDPVELFIITARDGNNFGQFIFPKAVLADHDILSVNGKGGKRAIRIYPPWVKTTSRQAQKTQTWQLEYFLEVSETAPIDYVRAQMLYKPN